MILRHRPRCRSLGSPLFYTFLFLAIGTSQGACASVDGRCPEPSAKSVSVDRCEGRYALCISASCNSDGLCGVTSAGAPCDQAGINAGSCGPCYIFEGFSCSYGAPCPSDESLHSTFSTELVDELGFKWTTWEPGKTRGWDCMDSPCIATGMTLSPQGESRDDGGIPTAICKCRRPAALRDQYVYLQVNSCSVDLASASWSTAPDPLGAHEGNFCSENSAD